MSHCASSTPEGVNPAWAPRGAKPRCMIALRVLSVWHVSDPLTSRDARQRIIDERFEVCRSLVFSPSGFVLIQLKNEESRGIGRRSIGQKKLHPRLRHGRLDQGLRGLRNGIFLAGFCHYLNCHDETLVQLSGRESNVDHRNVLLWWGLPNDSTRTTNMRRRRPKCSCCKL
jgi:hypothetical protein